MHMSAPTVCTLVLFICFIPLLMSFSIVARVSILFREKGVVVPAVNKFRQRPASEHLMQAIEV